MRILYLTHRLPYAPNRGDRIRAYHVLRHLSARHQVDLVSLVHDDEEASHVADLAAFADSTTIARVGRGRGLARAGAALLRGGTLTHALLYGAGLRRRLRAVVGDRRPDVVLAYCSAMARFALDAPLDASPFVLDMVDVDSEKWAELGRAGRTPMHWIYRREARLLRAFERAAILRARATLVVNARERDIVRPLASGAAVEIVPNGIDLASYRPPAAPSEEPRVVFCGVMNYPPNEAGAEWLARVVWPLVRAARPDAVLTLVGARPTRRVGDLARGGSIEVTGSVPDVRPYLWRSAVAAAPLLVARGVQNKVLEALAAGLPAVITPPVAAGVPAEALPACVEAESADDFAARIVTLLEQPAAARRALAAAASLAPLEWSRCLGRLDAILAQAAR